MAFTGLKYSLSGAKTERGDRFAVPAFNLECVGDKLTHLDDAGRRMATCRAFFSSLDLRFFLLKRISNIEPQTKIGRFRKEGLKMGSRSNDAFAILFLGSIFVKDMVADLRLH